MKKILLKELHLVNFKGIASLDLSFNEGETTILGANGSGKTSTFDAFLWLLFGKDSYNRKEFSIKTYDTNGNPIPHLPHEVSAVLNVNGSDVKLRRTYEEKWGKVSGSVEETLKGHEVGYFYNDIPLSAKEYNERINDICSEQTFMLITNPMYFASLKSDVQRSLLFSLAGEIKYEDIAAGNESFGVVVDMLTGRTIDDLNKQIAAQKKHISDEMKSIPIRINEQQKNIIEDKNWDELQQRADVLTKEIAEANDAAAEIRKQHAEIARKQEATFSKLALLRLKRVQTEDVIRTEMHHEFNEAKRKYGELLLSYNSDVRKLTSLKSTLKHLQNDASELVVALDDLRAKWVKTNELSFSINENELVCPMCNRPLDPDDAEKKIAEMKRLFNENKAAELASINEKGNGWKKDLERWEKAIEDVKSEIEEVEKRLAEGEPVFDVKPVLLEDVQAAIADSEEIHRIDAEIAALEAERDSFEEASVSSEKTSEIAEKQKELNVIISELAGKAHREQQLARIEELMESQRILASELAALERNEALVLAFNQERVRVIEERINKLFKVVRFRMFETLINGNVVECCYPMVNGVPYATRSSSERINMGLDIINAICLHNSVSAPIFIDNRETITQLLDVDSQIISLKVEPTCNKLKVQ